MSILATVVLALGLPVIALAILSCCSRRPTDLGARDGFLSDCPSTRHCVCSQATRADQRIAPLALRGSPEEAWAKLKLTVARLPGSVIAGEKEGYLHVECTSRLFRFVDDLEFLADPERGVIHCRSASRTGRFDFGVHRRRLEAIRRAFDIRCSSLDG